MMRIDRTLPGDAGTAALLALLLVIPLAVLDAVNQSIALDTLPLYIFLWILPTVALTCVLQLRRGGTTGETRWNAFLRAACLTGAVLLAVLWIDLVIDQMPCFLGVPNCD